MLIVMIRNQKCFQAVWAEIDSTSNTLENFLHYSYFIIFVLLDHVTLLPVDVVESQFDNYLLSCKYLKSRVFRGAIVVMSSSQWLFATWISMFPQLRTEREIFAAKNCFLFCYHLHLGSRHPANWPRWFLLT